MARNALIALLDSDHLHHERARSWLKEKIKAGWASRPLTRAVPLKAVPG